MELEQAAEDIERWVRPEIRSELDRFLLVFARARKRLLALRKQRTHVLHTAALMRAITAGNDRFSIAMMNKEIELFQEDLTQMHDLIFGGDLKKQLKQSGMTDEQRLLAEAGEELSALAGTVFRVRPDAGGATGRTPSRSAVRTGLPSNPLVAQFERAARER